MPAKTIMVQGTTSSAGKSLIATALCRLFANAGYRVAPFKSQNMALNSFVTPDGGEIGRAQAVQAEAARVSPTVDMNPILLKPEADSRSQVVVLGKPIGSFAARDYHERKPELRGVVEDALARLRARFDVIVIEGAGSPAEINLKEREIVNMFVAKLADAPVLLVGDIDRGGVFAAFVGTMELLEPDERARIAAFVVNKFRGDVSLLTSGLEFLEKRTGVPVLGVVPYIPALRIAEEDSVSLDDRSARRRPESDELDVVVVRLPRISNYDDFDPLEHEAGVAVRFVDDPESIADADLVILPGSKSTVSDLEWLRGGGIADAIIERAAGGRPVLGVCGGCQILGEWIHDPGGVESSQRQVRGLGLLSLETRFAAEKTTAQVRARIAGGSLFGTNGDTLVAYEIHMGQVERAPAVAAAFEIETRNGRDERSLDGAVSASGMVVGTMLHGLFENASIRGSLLSALRRRRGLAAPTARAIPSRDAEYDRLTEIVRKSLNVEMLERILESGSAP